MRVSVFTVARSWWLVCSFPCLGFCAGRSITGGLSIYFIPYFLPSEVEVRMPQSAFLSRRLTDILRALGKCVRNCHDSVNRCVCCALTEDENLLSLGLRGRHAACDSPTCILRSIRKDEYDMFRRGRERCQVAQSTPNLFRPPPEA